MKFTCHWEKAVGQDTRNDFLSACTTHVVSVAKRLHCTADDLETEISSEFRMNSESRRAFLITNVARENVECCMANVVQITSAETPRKFVPLGTHATNFEQLIFIHWMCVCPVQRSMSLGDCYNSRFRKFTRIWLLKIISWRHSSCCYS